jgi:hypothetical protein
MTSTLLENHTQKQLPTILYGDNKDVQTNSSHFHHKKLCNHRQPNIDLWLEYKWHAMNINRKVEWVPSHQDDGRDWGDITDLKELKLTPAVYFNLWCDR